MRQPRAQKQAEKELTDVCFWHLADMSRCPPPAVKQTSIARQMINDNVGILVACGRTIEQNREAAKYPVVVNCLDRNH